MRLDTSEPIPAHIRALVQTCHALLEPVGSGATSCLACGACHWAYDKQLYPEALTRIRAYVAGIDRVFDLPPQPRRTNQGTIPVNWSTDTPIAHDIAQYASELSFGDSLLFLVLLTNSWIKTYSDASLSSHIADMRAQFPDDTDDDALTRLLYKQLIQEIEDIMAIKQIAQM